MLFNVIHFILPGIQWSGVWGKEGVDCYYQASWNCLPEDLDSQKQRLCFKKTASLHKPFTKVMITLDHSTLFIVCGYYTRHFECKRQLINCNYGAHIKAEHCKVEATCSLSKSFIWKILTFYLINVHSVTQNVMESERSTVRKKWSKNLGLLASPHTSISPKKRQPLFFHKLCQSSQRRLWGHCWLEWLIITVKF